jgi:DNA-binding CsgD family transcriptional regulator
MDKFVRNDDPNQEVDLYNHDLYPGLTVYSNRKSVRQNIKVKGRAKFEGEVLDKVEKATAKLTKQESILMNLVIEESLSIRQASKRMNISQPMAQKYWNRIKIKLK